MNRYKTTFAVELRLAAAGWLGGFGNPPPPPPPPPGWLAGWLARPWKTLKIRSAPLNRLFSRMVCVWGHLKGVRQLGTER